ncbi:MAG: hypothetical protein H0Z34_10915 [Brevibacillus sp.]|nr:hypothetical protein [Brevibacillus sp.]
MVYRVTLRLRSSDEKLAAWIDQHENKNEAILDALNQFLFGEELHHKYDQGSPPSSDPPKWARELQQMIQQVQDTVVQLESKIEARVVQTQMDPTDLRYPYSSQHEANQQPTPDEESRFRDLAKGILNF